MQIFSQGHSGVAVDREGYLMLSPLELLWVLGSDWQRARWWSGYWHWQLRLLSNDLLSSSPVPALFMFFVEHSPLQWLIFMTSIQSNKKVIKLWTSGQDFTVSATKDVNYRIKKINKFSWTTPRTLVETTQLWKLFLQSNNKFSQMILESKHYLLPTLTRYHQHQLQLRLFQTTL